MLLDIYFCFGIMADEAGAAHIFSTLIYFYIVNMFDVIFHAMKLLLYPSCYLVHQSSWVQHLHVFYKHLHLLKDFLLKCFDSHANNALLKEGKQDRTILTDYHIMNIHIIFFISMDNC